MVVFYLNFIFIILKVAIASHIWYVYTGARHLFSNNCICWGPV